MTEKTRDNEHSGSPPCYVARCSVNRRDFVKVGFDRSVSGGSIYVCMEISGEQEDVFLTSADALELADALQKLVQIARSRNRW